MTALGLANRADPVTLPVANRLAVVAKTRRGCQDRWAREIAGPHLESCSE